MVCAFTGHRPEKLPWGTDESDPRCQALKLQLHQAIFKAYRQGADVFACGFARGCDLYFAEAVLELKKRGEPVCLMAWIPCPEQADRWPSVDQLRYREALLGCKEVRVLQDSYTPGCMLRRNRAMLDAADMLISVYDGTGGGTGAAVVYANSLGISIDALWL